MLTFTKASQIQQKARIMQNLLRIVHTIRGMKKTGKDVYEGGFGQKGDAETVRRYSFGARDKQKVRSSVSFTKQLIGSPVRQLVCNYHLYIIVVGVSVFTLEWFWVSLIAFIL